MGRVLAEANSKSRESVLMPVFLNEFSNMKAIVSNADTQAKGSSVDYAGGENFNLQEVLLKDSKLKLRDRVNSFLAFKAENDKKKQNFFGREILSAAGSEVVVKNPFSNECITMLMFGSNNYLALANHPYVKEAVHKVMAKYGVGIGGPPLLNGYTRLHRELEERLAALKHTESAALFSSGYNANVGLISGLITKKDLVLYDKYSHASFCDGLKMSKVTSLSFAHNQTEELDRLLQANRPRVEGDVFVGVEGVYSMDGDLAPLDKIVPLVRKHKALLVLDDAHGTGLLGEQGAGTAAAFGVADEVDITMGTFSKAFSVSGGFIAASEAVISYLKFFARLYMFSASLPPVVVAAVLAGLDIVEKEPEHRGQLHANVRYATELLRPYGLAAEPKAAIIALRAPEHMNIRQASYLFHQAGIFLNSVEFPAVPVTEQRFRISIMSTHTKAQIDRLVEAVDYVWKNS